MNDPWTRKEISKVEFPDHSYLGLDDRCLFFLEYTAREGYEFSCGNDFILNLKKAVSRKGTPEYKHKTRVIKTAGKNLAKVIGGSADKMVCVPIPPSKRRSDDEYDDRMVQVLHEFEIRSRLQGRAPLVLELVEQKDSMRMAHTSASNRPRPEELARNYEIRREEREILIKSGRKHIYVVDDLLTTGAHFKAMQRVILAERIPGIKVMGIFLARRIPSAAEESELRPGGGEP